MTQENTNGDTRSAAPSAQDRPQIPQHEVSIADLSKKILATDKQYDLSKILSAYQLAEKAHADQKRSSGEPYIIHPLAVADILLDLGMDTDTICVGLLHDVVEDTNYTLDDIRKKFGQDVAMLVDGVTKLNRIPIFDKEQQQAENVRKILLAMSHDIRVMIIKLADRIHNMRTLKFLPPEKQRRIALETMNVYAPIAHRLGIRTTGGLVVLLSGLLCVFRDRTHHGDQEGRTGKVHRLDQGANPQAAGKRTLCQGTYY